MQRPNPARMRLRHRDIDPVFLDTPVVACDNLPGAEGIQVSFKDERASPIGSFKGRGSDLLVKSFSTDQELVCASAGNFGQGMAWSVRQRGGGLIVFAAETAARCKIEAMRNLGADVILTGSDFDEAKDTAKTYAAEWGKIFIEDGSHVEIAEGAGTIALELTDQCDDFDTVFIPVGNGSLAAGIGCWFKHHRPRTQIIAVVARGAPAMGLALLGKSYEKTNCDTIADGIAIRIPIPAAVEAVRKVVDTVLFVSDAGIRQAMTVIEDFTGATVEAAGAAGLAGLLATRDEHRGKRVAIPICGGNRDDAS
jgi:threonine dehydratase